MQFGKYLDCIVFNIFPANTKFGHIYLFKANIADRFYWIIVRIEDILKLLLGFPPVPIMTPLVSIPLTLSMGWKLLPPHLCADTETITDLKNHHIKNLHISYLIHPLNIQAELVTFHSNFLQNSALSYLFIDDVIGISQVE